MLLVSFWCPDKELFSDVIIDYMFTLVEHILFGFSCELDISRFDYILFIFHQEPIILRSR